MPNETTFKDLRGAITFRSSLQYPQGEGPPELIHRSFDLKSYKWMENYDISGQSPMIDMATVPKLILTEIQPKKKPDWSKVLADAAALERIPGIEQIVKVFNVGPNAISQLAGANYLNKLTDEYSSNMSKSKELLDISDIEKLVEGDVINTYEIPFFNAMYLSSMNKDGWTIGSALDGIGTTAEVINDGFQMNILKHPQWQNNNNEGPGWETEFYLINDTLDNLYKNFSFINSIFPGTQWVRMKHTDVGQVGENNEVQGAANNAFNFGNNAAEKIGVSLSYARSPNLFKVICPGRFQQLFVALDITVEFVGAVRRMPLYKKVNLPNSMVNENTLFPDAYKISISARDLTPACYNVYANFLMGQETVTVNGE